MALVEMGPVTNTLMRAVTKKLNIDKTAAPLFKRDAPRTAGVNTAPIETAPINAAEAQEQNTLRGLRSAIHSDKRA